MGEQLQLKLEEDYDSKSESCRSEAGCHHWASAMKVGRPELCSRSVHSTVEVQVLSRLDQH